MILNRHVKGKAAVIINMIAFVICISVFTVVLLWGVLFSSDYDFADFPYFSINDCSRIIYIIAAAGILFIHMQIGRVVSWNIWVCFILYSVISIVYIIIIPLEPFSDMGYVYNIALNGMKDDSGYLSVYSNQIPIAVYLWIITSIFGKNIIVPKVFNIIWNIVTLIFMYKIYRQIVDDKDNSYDIFGDKAVIWTGSIFIPVIMYVNHIYNDILFTALTMMLVYLVLSDFNGIRRFFAVYILSVIQFLVRPSGIIYIIAIALYLIVVCGQWKKSLLYIIVTLISITGVKQVNNILFNVDKTASYPVWSYIQMGINEEEFGFQDGTHSPEWTMQDCVDRYNQLGFLRVIKIWAKKELWMWSEGTYQAERYGFGDSAAVYTSANEVNESLRDISGSSVRNILEHLMKAQYYIYMLAGLEGLLYWRNDNRIKLVLYVICGFFFFYLIWEIKSRYIFSLWPFVIMMAYYGIIRVKSRLKEVSGNRFIGK